MTCIIMRLAQMILMTVMITFCIGVISDQSIACLITVIDSDISKRIIDHGKYYSLLTQSEGWLWTEQKI